MPDPITLSGQKERHQLPLTSASGDAIALTLNVQGIQGALALSSPIETRALRPRSLDPARIGEEVDPQEKILEYFYDFQEELEMEYLQDLELDAEAVAEEEVEFLLELEDEEHQFAILEMDDDGVLSWTLPEEPTSPRQVLKVASTNTPTSAFRSRSVNAGRRRKIRLPLFRWFRKKVEQILVKKPRFYQYRFNHKRKKKKAWRVMKPGRESDWAFLKPAIGGKERALLLFHGFFGGPGNFHKFLRPHHEEIQNLYGDRVFAFDHPSLFKQIAENADQFYDLWPRDYLKGLQVDVFTRSRGSLVFRQITELRQEEWQALEVQARRVIMLAGPNEGTPLARPKNIRILIKVVTNLLANTIGRIPIPGLRLLIRLLQFLLLHNMEQKFTGLFCQSPESPFVTTLNEVQGVNREHYRAISVQCEPKEGPLWRLADRLFDRVFGEKFKENDFVNPTFGVEGKIEPADGFKIPTSYVEVDQEIINHLNYFDYSRIREQILQWMAPDGEEA